MDLRSVCLGLFMALGPVLPSAAQGLVQIALEGAITVEGGGRVELAVTTRVGEETRTARLDMHLAQGTDAQVLGALLAERARLQEQRVMLFEGARSGTTPTPGVPVGGGGTSLFFADVVSVELRVPPGLVGRLVVCEEAPSLVRLLPPQASTVGPSARLVLAATTLHPVTGAAGRTAFELDLPADGSAVRASDQLFSRTVAAGWVADRPENDAWRPLRVGDGSLVRGLSVEVVSAGPNWGLAIELEAPRQ